MLWTALLLGLFGGLHCVGMCGPIALALPRQNNVTTEIFAKVLYNSGRIVTYMLMGALIGLLGSGFNFVGFQQGLSIFSGVLLILLVLLKGFKNLEFTFFRPMIHLANKLKFAFGKFIKKKTPWATLMIGLLNGLLPCGLVYIALAASLATGNFIESALYMGIFGLGTFPMMFAIAFSGRIFSPRVRQKLYKVIPVFVILLGTLFILRGLNLGIPYVSPQINAGSVEQFEMCAPE